MMLRTDTLKYELVGIPLADKVAEIIQGSFAKQAEILQVTKDKYPHYVAFETPERVIHSINHCENVILAYVAGKPIGTVRFSIDSNRQEKGYISRLAVLPEFRGNRYGEMLMYKAEEHLKELNARIVEISIVASFKRLQNFYEKLGYIARGKRIFPSLPFQVLFMEKTFEC